MVTFLSISSEIDPMLIPHDFFGDKPTSVDVIVSCRYAASLLEKMTHFRVAIWLLYVSMFEMSVSASMNNQNASFYSKPLLN